MKFLKSLKFKILAIGISLSMILLVSISFLIYRDLKSSYIDEQIQYNAFNLQMTMNNIDKDYLQIMRFASWLSNNEEVSDFLLGHKRTDVNVGYLKVNAFKAVQMQLLNMSIIDDIKKCIIFSNDGTYIQVGRAYGHDTDYQNRFTKNMDDSQIKIHGIVDSPYSNLPNEKLIPISSSIYSSSGARAIGWAEISVDTDVITQYISEQVFENGSRLFIIIGDKPYEISNSSISSELDGFEGIMDGEEKEILDNIYLTNEIFAPNSNGSILAHSQITGWTIVQTLPEFSLSNISFSAYHTIFTVIGIVIFVAGVMIFVLFQIINRPIERIRRRISLIANGDFSYDTSIETEDELGYIGKGINNMSSDLKKWIETSLEIQNMKKNYEFKMLQSQINPHFLYNTLNSIKWMGSIQRSVGIVEMATALIRMLRRISKINNEVITVDEELEFISDYVVIQQYRYGGMFSVHYNLEDEGIRKAKIIKFTIQPLVENAIFHGIEPKNEPGNIEINIYTKDEALIIEVRDDGVGIEMEKLMELNKFSTNIGDDNNHIGLGNIHERIVMEYGQEYGLRIASEKNKYTCVSVRVPLIY